MVIDLSRPVQSFATDPDGLVYRSTVLPQYTPGRYAAQSSPPVFRYVPSLSYMCIRIIQNYPDRVQLGKLRLNYRPAPDPQSFDLVRALVPSFSRGAVDPRLWATLAQLYDNLPPDLLSYSIPLADEHLPLIQTIPSTPRFSLITILHLYGCSLLTDDTIIQLKALHSLTAFDAGRTQITPLGIKLLAETLLWTRPDGDLPVRKRGPWQLRILNLLDCQHIDNAVAAPLHKFPLLSIIDLRGTQCSPGVFSQFRQCPHPTLFRPHPLSDALQTLATIAGSDLYSSENIFTLYIDVLYHSAYPLADIDIKTWFPGPPSRGMMGETSSYESSSPDGSSDQDYIREADYEEQELSDTVEEDESDTQELQDLADAELQFLADRDAVHAFYRALPGLVGPSFTEQRALSGLSPIPRLPQDARLMLWRKPPPWSTLESYTKPSETVRKSTKPEVASVNSSKKKQWLQARQRGAQRSLNQPTPGLTPPHTQTALANSATSLSQPQASRNPFRRKPSDNKSTSNPQVSALPMNAYVNDKSKSISADSGNGRLKRVNRGQGE